MDILIPCKAFSRGKSRLAGVLTRGQRAALCQRLYRHTLAEALATGARVAVVSADAEVSDLAREKGARVIADPGAGLNAALALGVATLGGRAPLMVLPIDLPGVSALRLAELAATPGITLIPDRRDDGTNLMLLGRDARDRFRLAYGQGSLARHARIARDLALPLAVRRDPDLALDLDLPADLGLLPHALTHLLTRGPSHEAA